MNTGLIVQTGKIAYLNCPYCGGQIKEHQCVPCYERSVKEAQASVTYCTPCSECDRLRSRLAAMERGGVCIWCGESLDLTGKNMASAIEWARQHDENCAENPLRSRLAEAGALLREARDVVCIEHHASFGSRYAGLLHRIDAFLTPPGGTGL